MFTWLGIIVGIGVAYYGFKRGFFEMWGKFFNLLISIYLSLFLRPVIIEYIPDAGNSWLGNTLTILLTGAAIFFILHGISYVAFGQFKIELPKIFDITCGALIGFLGGVLLWSFLILLLSITPLSQNAFAQKIGMAKYSSENKATYICLWGDLINLFTGSREAHYSTEQVMAEIFKSAEDSYTTKRERSTENQKSSVVDPNKLPDEKPSIEEELGPPPELDFYTI
jgi:hypothetical protein